MQFQQKDPTPVQRVYATTAVFIIVAVVGGILIGTIVDWPWKLCLAILLVLAIGWIRRNHDAAMQATKRQR